MKKVIVIGCPGSGKSTFARALHNKTGIPLYHLDMEHTWGPTAQAYGTTDKIPEEWLFTRERTDEIFVKYAR